MNNQFALDPVAAPTPFESAVLQSCQFPLAKEKSVCLHQLLVPWLSKLAARNNLLFSIWLQGPELHRSDAAKLLVSHGREWMPDIGLGIRPDGEPPRMLKSDDFNKRKWNDPVTLKHETAFCLMADTDAAFAAYSSLCGSGAITLCLLDSSLDEYLEEQRILWLPTIVEPAFRAHPFYMPIFQRSTLRNIESATLGQWMGRSRLYLRESREDLGIFVISSIGGSLSILQEDIVDSRSR